MNEYPVLLVDDDANVLKGYERSLRRRFHVETALCSEEAITAVNFLGPFAVVISDMTMPRVNGVQLLQKILDRSPDSVRIMLTGNADQQTAIDAVNVAGVFRFLSKPCSPELLGEAIEAGIAQYRRRLTERQLLAETVNGVVRLLCDVLGVANPDAFGRGARLQRLIAELAREDGLPDAWQAEMAAMLSQIAYVAKPNLAGTLIGGKDPFELAAKWIHEIPRLEGVADLVAWQRADAAGVRLAPRAAQLLRAARDYDECLHQGLTPPLAVSRLKLGGAHELDIVELLASVVDREPEFEERTVAVKELALGMVLAADVVSQDGRLLVKAGQEVTSSLRTHLAQHVRQGTLSANLIVLAPLHGEEPVAAGA